MMTLQSVIILILMIGIVAFAILSISTSYKTVLAQSGGYTTFENQTMGIRFQYPSNWYKQFINHTLLLTNKPDFQYGKTETGRNVFMVTVYNNTTGLTFDEFSSNMLHEIDAAGNYYKAEKTTVSGLPAYFVDYSFNSAPVIVNKGNFRALVGWLLKDSPIGKSKLYTITFIADRVDFDIYHDEFQKLLNSISVY